MVVAEKKSSNLKMSMLRKWVLAIRPQTLPIGIMPVLLSGVLAWRYGVLVWSTVIVAAFCAILMQILSNLVNDVYDAKKGADSEERLGPTRVVASGIISAKIVSRVSWCVGILAFLCGQFLVWQGGVTVLCVGIVSLFFAWAYTGGKYPLAYHGFGEILAFIFFGVIPVVTTFFIQSEQVPLGVLIASCIPGLLAAMILLVNNIRDIDTDMLVGKNTIAVRLGRRGANILYTGFMLSVYVLSLALVWICGEELWISCITIPLGYLVIVLLWKAENKEYNSVLKKTVIMLNVHCIIIAIGIVLSK